MGCWFKSYESEDGFNQPRWWYEQQASAVQGHILAQVDAVAGLDDEIEEFVPLPGRYVDLSEMPIGIRIDQPLYPDEEMRHIGLLGFWEGADYPVFIVLICSEMDTGNYTSLLERALRLKQDWEQGKGAVYDLFFDEESNWLVQ